MPVVWQCDGVHGNTTTGATTKLKTRALEDVMSECTKALAIHRANGSVLGGVHLELTGQVTISPQYLDHLSTISRPSHAPPPLPHPQRCPHPSYTPRHDSTHTHTHTPPHTQTPLPLNPSPTLPTSLLERDGVHGGRHGSL